MLIVLAGYGNLQFNHLYYNSYDLCNYHGSVIEDRSTIFTKYKIKDQHVWFVVFASVIITSLLASINPETLGGYVIGYELLPINGLLTFLGLILIRRK